MALEIGRLNFFRFKTKKQWSKMSQKRATTAVSPKKKIKKKRKVANNFFGVLCIARTRWVWNAGNLANFKVK